MPPGMLVQHVYDSPSVVDAAIADVNERGRGKRLKHVVPLGSNLDDLDLLRRLREVEKDSYGKVVAEETGEREKLKKKILERLSGSRLNIMIDQQSIEIFII